MPAPPVLVTVEVVDDCVLVYDQARGGWTLRHGPHGEGIAREARRLPRGTTLTLVWPEARQ